MIARVRFLVLGLSVAAVTLSAQRRNSDAISVDSARVVLGTDPLVVPDLPIRSIHVLFGMAVLIEQQGDSGEVLILREVRGGPSIPTVSPADLIGDAPREAVYAALHGQPVPAERRLDRRRRHRYIEPLNVTVMGWGRSDNWEALLDRLAPLRR